MKGNHALITAAKEAVMYRVASRLNGGRTIYQFDDGSYALEPWDGRPFSRLDDAGNRVIYGPHEYRAVLMYVDGVGWFSPVEDLE